MTFLNNVLGDLKSSVWGSFEYSEFFEVKKNVKIDDVDVENDDLNFKTLFSYRRKA